MLLIWLFSVLKSKIARLVKVKKISSIRTGRGSGGAGPGHSLSLVTSPLGSGAGVNSAASWERRTLAFPPRYAAVIVQVSGNVFVPSSLRCTKYLAATKPEQFSCCSWFVFGRWCLKLPGVLLAAGLGVAIQRWLRGQNPGNRRSARGHGAVFKRILPPWVPVNN